MNLIFNKNNKGQEELKRALGFLDKTITYSNLGRFIKAATRQVYLIIGKATHDVIVDYYTADQALDSELELVEALQDCIAVDAYRHYAPSKDVGHTNNGRRMRVDDHEKQAFEWMIDRDNDNMERMYYESIDHLLELLEGVPSWLETAQYKKLNALFLNSTAAFQEYFDINHSRLLLQKLIPGIRQCERSVIVNRLGEEYFNELKADRTLNTELVELIKECCVWWSLSWAMSGRLTVTLFPEGVLQRFTGERSTTQGKKPPLMNEYAWAAQNFQADANKLLLRIEEMVAPPVVVTENDGNATIDTIEFDQNDNFIDT